MNLLVHIIDEEQKLFIKKVVFPIDSFQLVFLKVEYWRKDNENRK